MIEESFRYANRKDDPRYNPRPQTTGLVNELIEATGIRPFTEEW